MSKLLGGETRKIHPKLRMVANCSTEVNAVRAEQAAYMTVSTSETKEVRSQRGEQATPCALSGLKQPPQRPKLKKLPADVWVNVFVETQDTAETPGALRDGAQRGNLIVKTVRVDELRSLADNPDVTHVEPGEPLATPTPEVSRVQGDAPQGHSWRAEFSKQHREGQGVLIGIIDVQGFDFAHPDFVEHGHTRFVRIWDQGGDAHPSPHARGKERHERRYGKEFDFGAELQGEDLDRALAAAPQFKVPPQELEPQSQMAPGSHGTHVASIAAGKSGVCPKAEIAAVLISLPAADQERRQSFYDSTRVALAVDYLLAVADELDRPISINISLGTNGHAHDGSSALSRWIDSALAKPGRAVCVAAGNAGQEVATFEGDLGYIMGRIHTRGRVAGRYRSSDIEWIVVGNGRMDISENELEVWYGAQDRFAVRLLPPGEGGRWIGPVRPGEYIENLMLGQGSLVSIYNELYHPANGSNYIAVYLTPFFSDDGVVGIPAGQWLVRLEGLDVRDGAYHGWIERDDPRRLGRVGALEAWRFPSFFSESSNVDESSVGSLACGRRVISVANYHGSEERVHITSSQGPTRDNRCKPDVAARGTDVVAANGFAGRHAPWVSMTGTSMASPYVAGVVGLMLACNPRLTAAQIEGILHRTSRPIPGNTYQWINDAGFGVISPSECLREALAVNERRDLTEDFEPRKDA